MPKHKTVKSKGKPEIEWIIVFKCPWCSKQIDDCHLWDVIGEGSMGGKDLQEPMFCPHCKNPIIAKIPGIYI